MSNQITLHPKKVLRTVMILFLVVVAVVLCFRLTIPKTCREDYKRIASENYDTVFLSMFPINNYEEGDFKHYRNQTTLKTSYCIPNFRTLQSYLKRIAESGNTVTTIYLGVEPNSISAVKLHSLLQKYVSVQFQVILPYASMDYWTALSDEQYREYLKCYRELTDTLLLENHISVYHFSYEWLICNPGNYSDTFLINKDISRTLMLNCDRDHKYLVTPENVDAVFGEFAQLVEQKRKNVTVYPDLSDYKIVFFGDSIIGNYTDSASISGVVNGLTKAAVYNCGYGGNSASMSADAIITLPGIVDAFINKDTSPIPKDTQVYKGVTEYLQDDFVAKDVCFVINYGLNDYFSGAPVSTEDSYDITSYSGALRTAITALQNAYPEAQILLMTPSFTSYFNNGTEKKSDVGGELKDYIQAAIDVAVDCNVDIQDNYTDLNINADNYGAYLVDGCHPNEGTRFTIGNNIALSLR